MERETETETQRERQRGIWIGWQWADLGCGIFFSTFLLFFQFLIFLEEWTFWSLLDFLWAGCTTPLMVFNICWFFLVKELFHFCCSYCCCNNGIVNEKWFTKVKILNKITKHSYFFIIIFNIKTCLPWIMWNDFDAKKPQWNEYVGMILMQNFSWTLL